MNLYAVHGFLGSSKDWQTVSFHSINSLKSFHPIDLFNDINSVKSFDQWAKNFNELIEKEHIKLKAESKPVVLGYSLGGRLLLHALEQNYNLYAAAIFISTNLGLTCEKEKKERLANDLKWKNRFLSESWDTLMKEWNNQPVFKGFEKDLFIRREEVNSRKNLADALDIWSIARQKHFKSLLESWSIPILWIIGSEDEKYFNEALKIKFLHQKSKIWIAEECGHRVPWQNQKAFIKTIKNFLDNL